MEGLGRAIECLVIVIVVYLLLSLVAAAVSHALERRSQWERPT